MTDVKKLRELTQIAVENGSMFLIDTQSIIEVLDMVERYREALIEFADYDNQYEPNMVCWPASEYMKKAREALEGWK